MKGTTHTTQHHTLGIKRRQQYLFLKCNISLTTTLTSSSPCLVSSSLPQTPHPQSSILTLTITPLPSPSPFPLIFYSRLLFNRRVVAQLDDSEWSAPFSLDSVGVNQVITAILIFPLWLSCTPTMPYLTLLHLFIISHYLISNILSFFPYLAFVVFFYVFLYSNFRSIFFSTIFPIFLRPSFFIFLHIISYCTVLYYIESYCIISFYITLHYIA